MIITIDIDNTLVDSYTTFQNYCKKYGYELKFPIKNYDFKDQSKETYHFLQRGFQSLKFTETLFEGTFWDKKTLSILNDMSKKHSIIFVSARSDKLLHDTKKQLESLGINTKKMPVICLGKMEKAKTLKALRTDLHIDDSEYVVKECVENGINAVLFCNNMLEIAHATRRLFAWTDSWQKIPEIVDKLKERQYS